MNRSRLAFLASVALLVAFLLFLGPARLAAQLAGVDLLFFALGAVAIVAMLLCWSEGLRRLLDNAGGPASPWRVFVAYSAAMFGNQIVPMGAVAGPAITAFAVDREVSLSYDGTLAAVTVAEFLSTVASLVLGVAALLVLSAGPAVPLLRTLVLAVGAFAALLGALAAGFWYRRHSVERALLGSVRLLQLSVGRFSTRLAAPLGRERTRARLADFYGTVDDIAGDRRTLAVSFGYHQLGWLFAALPLYTSALALDVRLPLALAVFLVPASNLVAVLPLPGGLGGVEIVLAGVLVGLVGIDLALAAAVVFLYRLWAYWFLVFVGAVASVYSAGPVARLPGAGK